MLIFTCNNSFEDMMCCIFTAWESAIKYGHSNVRLLCEPIEQRTLFDEYIHVDFDEEKYDKVCHSISKKISDKAMYFIYCASLSVEDDALDCIYRFLIYGFKVGAEVTNHYNNPYVMRLLEIKRKVSNEAHFFVEFVRFNSLDNKLYVSHIEPKSDILYFVGEHFADRMPSEYWMIIDDTRKKAVIHPKDGENEIRLLTEDEYTVLKQTELVEDEYTRMWRSFFNTIAISQRENRKCQRNLMPIWLRKHATEFNVPV